MFLQHKKQSQKKAPEFLQALMLKLIKKYSKAFIFLNFHIIAFLTKIVHHKGR